ATYINNVFSQIDTQYYKILGVKPSASQSEIKRAYHKLAKQLHPDTNPDPQAHDSFTKVAEAYSVLSDEEKREVYDNYGLEALKNENKGDGGGGFGDILSQYFFFSFSRLFGGSSSQSKKMPDIIFPLQVSLAEVYSKRFIKIEIKNQRLCPHCRGTGAYDTSSIKTCTTCNGRGIRVTRVHLGPGMYQEMQRTCESCSGKGRVVSKSCKECRGRKVMPMSHFETLEVQRGMTNGDEIVLKKAGDRPPEYIAGDIKFVVSVLPHPVFVRRGDDLAANIVVTLKEALFGFKRAIEHLDGRQITVQTSGVTQPEHVLIIKGEGMPPRDYHGDFGDMHVTVRVIFPRNFTKEERELLEGVL
ncbi:hypothetical protein Zmor_019159, partial [Zophobas morio]